MFKRKTVFVIGAGCSYEFGLPLGNTLRDRLFSFTTGGEAPLIQECIARCGLPYANEDIVSRLTAFARGLHTEASIDQYLNFHRNDPVFVFTGKALITAVILRSESASQLGRDRIQNGMDAIKDTWLMKLFEGMNDNTDLSTVEKTLNNVSFICFNYDRCIEVGIFNALRFLTDFPPEQVAQIVKKLKIWHPYGTVGRLDFSSFGPDNPLLGFPSTGLDVPKIVEGARSLRTFTEGTDDTTLIDQMHDVLANAEQLVFLGFSFLDENMKLLQVPITDSSTPTFATTYKISEPDVERAKLSIASTTAKDSTHIPIRQSALTVLSATATDFFTIYGNSLRR